MESVIAGLLALAVAAAFFWVLLGQLVSVPLWIVILLGFVLMVASFAESLRQEGGGQPRR